jgi:hypothetical protein
MKVAAQMVLLDGFDSDAASPQIVDDWLGLFRGGPADLVLKGLREEVGLDRSQNGTLIQDWVPVFVFRGPAYLVNDVSGIART